ncbi:FAD binding domain-containing protein [Coralloluteibacterium stylophorae]|uniref:Xanthine dehydrogenase family protein subunit M n=2 Tax=Coralloluteibacterium stylophorae TaxID=1776034 RepID=A0AAP2C793_9GAMM|nr:xanthine dehydrogenase family protein subunit M [Coralloluteibacterium stylophorae]MBS7455786.1 xanthine dehydrogenase family protein subunit M [Coralloluteibacterium stylophorae]
MNPITYVRSTEARAAVAEIGVAEGSSTAGGLPKFIAGGTNLVDLMKENVMRPGKLVDINGLGLDAVEEAEDGGLLLGALGRNADTAYHPLVRERYPLLSSAILAGASPQIRNMASNGGNLLQRTRCYYFYDAGMPCNKRNPGAGCSAIGGLTRLHAILGASEHCIATHPSDMCVALAALDARVRVVSQRGERTIDFAEFHRLPGDRPDQDTTLAHDELITHIALPPAPRFAAHSAYLKLRDRASYAFALVSVAAALDLGDDGRIREARVALGGVAHKPWRLPAAEALLAGAAPSSDAFARVADALLEGAQGQGGNEFKIPMAQRAVVRALETAAAGTVRNDSAGDRAGSTEDAT